MQVNVAPAALSHHPPTGQSLSSLQVPPINVDCEQTPLLQVLVAEAHTSFLAALQASPGASEVTGSLFVGVVAH